MVADIAVPGGEETVEGISKSGGNATFEPEPPAWEAWSRKRATP